MPESPEKVRDSFTPQELRARVEALLRLYQHGALSSAQFNDFLSAFRFNDEIGHLWSPGANSGKWYRWDRTAWTEAEPPPALMLANENMQRSAEWMLTSTAAAAGPPAPASASGGVSATGVASSLQCSKCKRTYSSGVFCTACGGKLEKVAPPPPPSAPAAQLLCVQCHKTFSSGTFCTECGGKLQPASVQPSAAKTSACPSCGSALLPKAKFCTGCGKPVSGAVAAPSPPPAPVCPNSKCGKPVRPGLKFCTACGTRVTTAPA